MNSESDLSPQIRPVPSYLPHRIEDLDQSAGEDIGLGDLRSLFEIIYKYRALIVGLATFSSLCALVYAFTATPLFTATATLQISTYEPVLAGTDVEEVLRQSSRDQEYVGTRIEEARSFAVADRVLSTNDIRNRLYPPSKESKGFLFGLFGGSEKEQLGTSSQYKNTVEDIQEYLNSISVSPVRRTSLVKLSITTENPAFAAEVANTHAEVYTDWIRESRIQRQSEGLKFLRGQSEELKIKIARLERELADYAEEHSIVALNKDENITVSKMASLSSKLTTATEARIEAEKNYLEADKSQNSGLPGAGFDDASLQTSRALLAQLEAEYGNLLQKFTPQYPRARQLKAQIDQLKVSIENGRKQIVLGLKARAEAALQKEKQLQEELDKQKSKAFELSKSQVEYNILNRELMSSRELLQTLLRQIKETALAVQSNASNVSILNFATPPLFASFPNKKLIALVGLLLGAGLGVSAAFFLNHLDNTVRSAEELSQTTKVANLGIVPVFGIEEEFERKPKLLIGNEKGAKKSSSEKSDKELLVREDGENLPELPIAFIRGPKSISAEAYRTNRTALLLSKAGESPKTILVTSGLPAEGKTTTASNLAATLASQDKRVVIVDADMRKPSVWRYFNIEPDMPGLVEILAGLRSIDEVIIKSAAENISVIPSGPTAPNPAELLGSRKMQEFIAALEKRYDHIIIDSPPVLPVTDAVILSRLVDGVVLVVKGASTPRKVVGDATNRLRNVGAKIFGTILNSVDLKRGGNYYYNHYYSRYYEQDEESERRGTGTA